MHDLIANYNKIAKVVEKFFNKDLNQQGNFRYYPNPPKMSDKRIIALSLSAESLGIWLINHLRKLISYSL